ncbi:MAG: SDR family oxidoreductase [Chloroflexi bacterium]|nr:SDR family oxidoreductase [Chloroflexota bacterium]MCH8351288.1 SDR family oxidoreductase [Chloroflexota bacterium]MCI0787760.1 SDR family oxidoreductase [Chloroflexota bacterium]MCI0794437.1 SDR family oxidoreductase [Chloroflexota bacterium]MCI0800106.1 SDR family oxidoreductase [Chloroflexota bacterium]
MAGELDARAAGGKRLSDKVCIVTGSGQGIGRATAKRLGEEGGTIVVADRVDESATRTVAELREHGVEAMKVLADVGSLAGAEGLMAEVVQAYGRIDVLVNNVGGTIWMQPYDKYTEEQVILELERTLYPTMWCCLAVLPIMMEQGFGSIVNLGSQSPRGLHRLPYAVGKGGIFALTKVLSMEYGSYGIRVNTVSPGGTAIPDRITSRQQIGPGEMVEIDDTEEVQTWRRQMGEDIRNQQAIKRSGMPEEQAAAIAFLASDDASFITGQVINCSGGQS